MKQALKKRYFRWLVIKVQKEGLGTYFSRLLSFLFEHGYSPHLKMDRNRSYDGIELRYQFGYDQNISEGKINAYLMDQNCSMLEMMVALALRVEENISYDDILAGDWFEIMLQSSGFVELDDDHWDENEANDILERIKTNSYSEDGAGGLFWAMGTTKDMRELELWYQCHEYLNTLN